MSDLDYYLNRKLGEARQFMTIKSKKELGSGVSSTAYPLGKDKVVTKTDPEDITKFIMYEVFQKHPQYFPIVYSIDKIRGITTLERLNTDYVKTYILEMENMIRTEFGRFLIDDQLVYHEGLTGTPLSVRDRCSLEQTLCFCFKRILFDQKNMLSNIESNIVQYLESGWEGWNDSCSTFIESLLSVTSIVMKIRKNEYFPHADSLEDSRLDFHFGNLAVDKNNKVKYIDI